MCVPCTHHCLSHKYTYSNLCSSSALNYMTCDMRHDKTWFWRNMFVLLLWNCSHGKLEILFSCVLCEPQKQTWHTYIQSHTPGSEGQSANFKDVQTILTDTFQKTYIWLPRIRLPTNIQLMCSVIYALRNNNQINEFVSCGIDGEFGRGNGCDIGIATVLDIWFEIRLHSSRP